MRSTAASSAWATDKLRLSPCAATFRSRRTAVASPAGSYRLRVTKSGAAGSSDINQSGDFSAGPGEPGRLGTVTLGGDGGSYVARLTVTWDGGSIECTERIGGTF